MPNKFRNTKKCHSWEKREQIKKRIYNCTQKNKPKSVYMNCASTYDCAHLRNAIHVPRL